MRQTKYRFRGANTTKQQLKHDSQKSLKRSRISSSNSSRRAKIESKKAVKLMKCTYRARRTRPD